ncbi:MAG: hypothetical protein KAW02_05360 [candidate division Zixibacteria bacterium]|nr:hypothetical protein [candidate division Zixibacteria bacterium]
MDQAGYAMLDLQNFTLINLKVYTPKSRFFLAGWDVIHSQPFFLPYSLSPPLHFMLKIPPEVGERDSPCPSVLHFVLRLSVEGRPQGRRKRIHPEGDGG